MNLSVALVDVVVQKEQSGEILMVGTTGQAILKHSQLVLQFSGQRPGNSVGKKEKPVETQFESPMFSLTVMGMRSSTKQQQTQVLCAIPKQNHASFAEQHALRKQ